MSTAEDPTRLSHLRRHWSEWLSVAGLCLGLAIAYSFAWKLRRSASGERVDWGTFPLESLVHFGCWALLYPGVVFLTTRFPLGERLRRNLPVHTVAALAFSPLLNLLTVFLNALTQGQGVSWSQRVRNGVLPEYAWGVTAYVVLLSVAHAAEFRRRDQARALGAVQLEAALAMARLNVLRMQLEPHFLFNALNSISSLVHRDPDGAERMLARLGDFLRLTLDDSMPQEVELRQELAFLERYLDIERVRFRDRLTVVLDVAPELLDARVPYLILQPLVENAIRHGIAERAGPGRISVRATRHEAQLALEVEDDGPGFAGNAAPARLGVGLANMRARLQQLYGDAGRLTLGNRPGQGARVTITLPRQHGLAVAAAGREGR